MADLILVVEDDVVLRGLLVRELQRIGHAVEGVGRWAEAESRLDEGDVSLVIMDVRLPDADGIEKISKVSPAIAPVIILTAHGTVQNAVRAMKAGAAEYLVKPVNLDELEVMVERVLRNAALMQEHQFFKSRIEAERTRDAMIGESAALKRVRELIGVVAPSAMNVLIQGESGTGKELVAQSIHSRSQRQTYNFVAVDCCTLPEKLFESELFGHERGAFTGADRQKKGLIEGAAEGTLFLDEIGEIDPSAQAKLLRVLETGRFRRIGGNRDVSANVRVVAATNRDLEEASRDGEFRADLYYRLSGFVITVPPLRQRREDIPLLVQHFIRNHDFSRRIDKQVDLRAMERLTSYDWPGNVRELKNVVERAIILSGDHPAIDDSHLAFGNSPAGPSVDDLPILADDAISFEGEPSLDEIKRLYLAHLLEKYDGHRSKVASILGISERNTYRLIQKFNL